MRDDLRVILSDFRGEALRKRPDLAEEQGFASSEKDGKTRITDELKKLLEEHGESIVGAKGLAKYERVQADLKRV